MSKFLDRFRYFKQKGETFADGHGQLLETNRDWKRVTVNAGSMTKLSAPLMALTAPVLAAGRFT